MLLTRDLLVKYLAGLGWKREETPDKAVFRMRPPADRFPSARSILFSVAAGPEGEAREVEIAVGHLQDVYGKTRAEIERGVASKSHDLLLGKVPDEYLRNDTIELRGVRSYMNGMRGLLANSATTVMTGHRAFPKSTRSAFDYADTCGFGHTFRGSFGLVIEAPLKGAEQTAMPFGESKAPLGRQVVERIAIGLASVAVAQKEDDAEAIVEREGGLNAAMCKDLISIIRNSGIPRIRISIAWSPEAAAPQVQSDDLVIEARQLRVLQQAHKRLTEEEDPIRVTITGPIIDLHSDTNPMDFENEEGERSVQISWASADYGVKKVLVKLDPRQYLTAHEAHGRGQLVQIEGRLSPRRPWTLEDVTKLIPLAPLTQG